MKTIAWLCQVICHIIIGYSIILTELLKTFLYKLYLVVNILKYNFIRKKEKTMIIIYDFDGTLTPYSLPKYEILIQNG